MEGGKAREGKVGVRERTERMRSAVAHSPSEAKGHKKAGGRNGAERGTGELPSFLHLRHELGGRGSVARSWGQLVQSSGDSEREVAVLRQ